MQEKERLMDSSLNNFQINGLVHVKCSLCNMDQGHPFLTKQGYQIVRCSKCRFLYVNPRPHIDSLRNFYQDLTYFQGTREDGYKDYFADKEAIETQSYTRLTQIERLTKIGRLLDVGCAAGYFLRKAQNHGWSIGGVEWSNIMIECAQNLLGIEIQPTITSPMFFRNSFDVVTMWEYLEHSFNPREELAEVNRLVRLGGVLALSTPNADNIGVRRRPEAWKEFKPPGHLSFFTASTLQGLVRSCGFKPTLVRGIATKYYRLPFQLENLLRTIKGGLGDRQAKRTRLWWMYSGLRHSSKMASTFYHRLFKGKLLCSEGLEMYAIKIEELAH